MNNLLDFRVRFPQNLLIKAVLFSSLFLLSACRIPPSFPPPSKGAEFKQVVTRTELFNKEGQITSVETRKELAFIQNENPKSKSKLSLHEDGEVDMITGTSEILEAVFPVGNDYTKYVCLLASLGFVAIGIFSISKGWAGVGYRFILAGTIGSVIALTIDSYGWLYTLAVLILAAIICWEKIHAYNKAELDLKALSNQNRPSNE